MNTYEHNPMPAYKPRRMSARTARTARDIPAFKPVKSTGPSYTLIILCAMATFGAGLALFSFLPF